MNNSKIIKNITTGFGGQLIILAMGIIVPRIFISSYGSDINGLLSTIGQIFTYVALLEAGIGQAARNALYKPIATKDREGITYIASVAKQHYKRISLYYGLAVLVLCFAAPLIIKTEVSAQTVFWIIFFEGMSGVVSFFFIQTSSMIITADGRSYITNSVNMVNKIVSYTVKIFMATAGINIILLQFTYFIITICKSFFYQYYFHRHYSWLKYKSVPRDAKLKDRNAYILTELAWTIFSSTDLIVLSVFVNTQAASVYSVYNMIFVSINMLLSAVYNSTNYLLGHTYHRDICAYSKLHDAYNSVFFGSMTVLVCVAYILALPFISLYTRGISDVNYIYESLPLMFCLIQMISWSRYISGNLTAVAGYAKYTGIISVVEAAVNLILSVILVQKMGIVGVLLATVCALPLKVVVCTYLSEKIILKRSPWRSLRIMSVNFALFFGVVWINKYLHLQINTYVDFVLYGCLITTVCVFVGVILNYAVNPECASILKNMRKGKK